MSRVILHVGAGKTGSSALQRYLSLRPEPLLAGDHRYEYCSLQADGTIMRNEHIRSAASASLIGYCSSAPELSTVDKMKFSDDLSRLANSGIIPIFSQESWLGIAARFDSQTFLSAVDEVEVVAYFRPQVDWFNSGWWQWWAWDSQFKEPADVLDLWTTKIMWWGHFLQRWSKIPNVSKIHARLSSRDIVGDFLGLYGIQGEHRVEAVNPAMGERMIKLYRALPGFRHPHGAEMDVYLSRYIKDAGETPWILEPETVERIVSETKVTNEILLSFLGPEQQRVMKADRRWWDSSAFADRIRASDDDLRIGLRDASDFLRGVVMDAIRRRP